MFAVIIIYFHLVLGHKGNLVFGMLSGLPVVCMQGKKLNYQLNCVYIFSKIAILFCR
jgi:hypothetical protein